MLPILVGAFAAAEGAVAAVASVVATSSMFIAFSSHWSVCRPVHTNRWRHVAEEQCARANHRARKRCDYWDPSNDVGMSQCEDFARKREVQTTVARLEAIRRYEVVIGIGAF